LNFAYTFSQYNTGQIKTDTFLTKLLSYASNIPTHDQPSFDANDNDSDNQRTDTAAGMDVLYRRCRISRREVAELRQNVCNCAVFKHPRYVIE